MIVCSVVGSLVATVKDESLVGKKLLIVEGATDSGEPGGSAPFVAIDAIGAGIGELVLVAIGSAARQCSSIHDKPVDAAIVGIIDSVERGGRIVFQKYK